MGDRMHRTQVYLPKALNSALDELARARGTTKADLMRRAAQRLVDEQSTVEDDPIWGLVGIGQSQSGPTLGGRSPGGRAAEEHDRYLAEAEVTRWKRRAT